MHRIVPIGAPAFAAVLGLLAAAASPAQGAHPRIRSLAEIRYEGVVAQKWDTSCGAAALATLLTYDLKDPVSEHAVATGMLRRTDPLRVRVRGGFSLLDLQRYAQARGYDADGYGEMTLADLREVAPAIVPVNFHGFDHFVVVRAVDGDQVRFADPAYGRRSLSVRQFERAWKLKIAFVVTRR
jgi:hypothetical protein